MAEGRLGAELAEAGRIPAERASLVDLLDRLMAGGVAVSGDLTLRIADVDLVQISLRLLIASVEGMLDVDPVPGTSRAGGRTPAGARDRP